MRYLTCFTEHAIKTVIYIQCLVHNQLLKSLQCCIFQNIGFYKAHFQVIQCHVLFSYTFKMISQKCVIYLNNNCIGRPVIINLNIVVRGF